MRLGNRLESSLYRLPYISCCRVSDESWRGVVWRPWSGRMDEDNRPLTTPTPWRFVFFRHHPWRVTILRRHCRPHHPQRTHMGHASCATLAGPLHSACPTRSLHPRNQAIPGPRDPRSRLRDWLSCECCYGLGKRTGLATVGCIEGDTVREEDVDEGPGCARPGRQKSRIHIAARLSASAAHGALVAHRPTQSVRIV